MHNDMHYICALKKIPSTGSHTIVWTHEDTGHTGSTLNVTAYRARESKTRHRTHWVNFECDCLQGKGIKNYHYTQFVSPTKQAYHLHKGGMQKNTLEHSSDISLPAWRDWLRAVKQSWFPTYSEVRLAMKALWGARSFSRRGRSAPCFSTLSFRCLMTASYISLAPCAQTQETNNKLKLWS